MHPLFIKLLIVIAVMLVVFVIVVSFQPAAFRVTRSAKMNALPESIFPHINDLRAWKTWSPWEKMDPAMKATFESASTSGVGATYRWSGNRQVGEGRMTIIESEPDKRVLMKLEFLKPFVATNAAEFTITPDGSSTVVTWTMTGRNNFMFKAVSLFMNCEKMVGPQFEEGLGNLTKIVERSAPKTSPAVN